MSPLDPATPDSLEQGNYFKQQFLCPNPVIAWSHRSRFRFARRLVEGEQPRQVLDYGCGDGTFLALNQDLFEQAVGVDLSRKQVAENRARLGGLPKLRFESPDVLVSQEYLGRFDLVSCMEVLEHCTEATAREILGQLHGCLQKKGTLLVSVPIEIGPSLLAKQSVRWVAGLLRHGDYQYMERYTWSELGKMLLAGPSSAIERPGYPEKLEDGRTVIAHGHKGFNYRALESWLGETFVVRRKVFSPMPWVRGLLNSQVYFLCSPR